MKIHQVIAENVATNWRQILEGLMDNGGYEAGIDAFLEKQHELFDGILEIFPPENLIFNAFNHFDFEATRVVFIFQDPYIGKGQAHGLAVSVPQGIPVPPSLANIFKELYSDLGVAPPAVPITDLTYWAKQGILLLNCALTVREGKSNSHQAIWAGLTNDIIRYLSERATNKIVFVLFGNDAKAKQRLIDVKRHAIITGVHPSPLSASRGFFGGRYFTRINTILGADKSIQWMPAN